MLTVITTTRETDIQVSTLPLTADNIIAAVAAAVSPAQYYDVRISWNGDRFDRYTVRTLTAHECRHLSEQTARQIVADAEARVAAVSQPRPFLWDWKAAA